jgi:NitT/TauT family transport system permease protein
MSKVAISVYVIFFAVFIAVYLGALLADQELVDAVKVMGASPRQVFFKVILPATAPNIYAALKLGIGLALIGAIAGEFIAARAGLGYMIFYATGTLDTPTVYLGIIILAVFSLFLQGAVNLLGRFLVRWKFRDEK